MVHGKPSEFKKGDIVLYRDRCWMVTEIGTTFLHDHHYVKIITYDHWNDDQSDTLIAERIDELKLVHTRSWDMDKGDYVHVWGKR